MVSKSRPIMYEVSDDDSMISLVLQTSLELSRLYFYPHFVIVEYVEEGDHWCSETIKLQMIVLERKELNNFTKPSPSVLTATVSCAEIFK